MTSGPVGAGRRGAGCREEVIGMTTHPTLPVLAPPARRPRARVVRFMAAGLGALLAGGWGLLLLAHGQPKVMAWWSLMGFGIAGIALVVLSCALLLRRAVQRRPVDPPLLVLLVLSLLAAWPGGWWVDVGNIAYPASLEDTRPAAAVRLPFDQPVRIGWGGNDLRVNEPHARVPFERWAYDIVADPASIGSTALADYGIYGAQVVAPADGTVTGVRDDAPDLVPGTEPDGGSLRDMLGNFVTLRLDDTGTYLVLAHLREGSVAVRAGQRVREGEPLGEVGNSGSTSEPHLHLHHQRQDPADTLLLAEGLPLFFRDTDGPPMPTGGFRTTPDGQEVPAGDVVAPLPTTARAGPGGGGR
jgi:hypothetical protein